MKVSRRRPRRAVALVVAALLAFLAAFLLYLNYRVSRRLGGDPALAHTRFLADRFRIIPGMDIEGVELPDRLHRLGYRENGALRSPGTFRRTPGALDIYLRAFKDPDGDLPPRLARLRLAGTRVTRVIDLRAGRDRAQATLEPEVLNVTWDGAWETRRPVHLKELPPFVPRAILAAEDSRFYQHAGVDFISVLRASFVNLKEGRIEQGASTITQQLAKNFFLTPKRTWRRKSQEALLAWILEARMTKDEILEWYLNEVYLGHRGAANVIGIGQAARTYFGKEASRLSVGEAATLAGIIRAPNANSPLRSPDRARKRRDAVLDRMLEEGWLTPEEAAREKRAPLVVKSAGDPALDALFFLEEVRREVAAELSNDAIMDGRLQVYTTLDPLMQRAAERGVKTSVERLERSHAWLRRAKTPLEGAFVIVDTRDGGVKALVGGRDFAGRPFDRAVRARRQAGSTFKPFVYLAAFQSRPREVTASTILEDTPLSIRTGGQIWQPADYDEHFRGRVTVRTALENSLNIPTVRLSQEIGVDTVARTAAAAGWRGDLPRVPALALGVAETSLLDLAGAYTVFPRLGDPVAPRLVRGVVRPDGKVLFARKPEVRHAADARAAYLVHHLLEGVVDRGTARGVRARGFEDPLAGKTGTTNDYRDAWFVGYTPDLVGAAWVGFDGGTPIRLSGAASALDVWAQTMRPILGALPSHTFTVPDGIVFVDVDPASGLLPAWECPSTIRQAYLAGTEPRTPCVSRPDLLASGGPIVEPLEAPARLIRVWVNQVRRILGGSSQRRPPPRAEPPPETRRRYDTEENGATDNLDRLRGTWERGRQERQR